MSYNFDKVHRDYRALARQAAIHPGVLIQSGFDYMVAAKCSDDSLLFSVSHGPTYTGEVTYSFTLEWDSPTKLPDGRVL